MDKTDEIQELMEQFMKFIEKDLKTHEKVHSALMQNIGEKPCIDCFVGPSINFLEDGTGLKHIKITFDWDAR